MKKILKGLLLIVSAIALISLPTSLVKADNTSIQQTADKGILNLLGWSN